MREMSPFAVEVRKLDLQHLPWFRTVSFPGTTLVVLTYLWPILHYSLTGYAGRPSPTVQRRALSLPLFVGVISFASWMFGTGYFVAITMCRFGRWSPEFLSQQVLSALVAGFLASTTSYLLVEWIVCAQILPRGEHLGDTPGTQRSDARRIAGLRPSPT